MTRLLTQTEVDALLASFGAESGEERVARELPFDLRAPLILVGDRLTLVQNSCERMAALLADAVGELFRAERSVRAAFFGLIQQPAPTLLSTLARGEALGVFVDEHGEPVGGLTAPSELTVALADGMLGGDGRSSGTPRPLSPVEVELFGEFLHRLAGRLARETALGWLRAGEVETEPASGRLGRRGGALASAQFRLSTPAGEAVCRLLMTPVLTNRLVADAPIQREHEAPAALVEAADRVPVVIEPVIMGAALRLTDLARLAPGGVVQFDVAEDQALGLRFNGLLLAQGRMRLSGAGRAIEILELASSAAGAGQEAEGR